jgi:hypothetical protein
MARVALFLLLLLTLTPKLLIYAAAPPRPTDLGWGTLPAFLEEAGWSITAVETASGGFVLVTAQREHCRLRVAEVDPSGQHTDVLRNLAQSSDWVSFVYEGVLSDEPPWWRPWLYSHWNRISSLIGLASAPRPILGVVSSGTCDLMSLPWRKVAI